MKEMSKEIFGCAAEPCVRNFLLCFSHVSFVQAASVKDVRILQCHGECDMMIPLQFGEMTHAKLRSFVNTAMLEFIPFAGLSHSSSSEVLCAALCLRSTFTLQLKKLISL